jgi:hypothetical protein
MIASNSKSKEPKISNAKAQMSNQIQSSNFRIFWALNFDIHLNFEF